MSKKNKIREILHVEEKPPYKRGRKPPVKSGSLHEDKRPERADRSTQKIHFQRNIEEQ